MSAARVRVIGVTIGVAAERAGMHPQTLREYERRGLVAPERTPGGARRYAEEQIEQLVHIQRLTEQGLSLAAVRYVLDLERRLAALEVENAQLREAMSGTAGVAATETGARDSPGQTGTELVHTRSVSVELVHVPRAPRTPRWSNREH